MNLLYSWKESLSLLKLQNLKLFTLVTVKSLFELYKLLFFKYWWSALATLFLIVITSFSNSSLLATFYYTLLLLYSRPSIENKNSTYIFHYLKYIPAIFIINLLILLPFTIIFIIKGIALQSSNIDIIDTDIFIFYIVTCITTMTLLSDLFILDSSYPFKNITRSIQNGLKMFLFNIPLMTILITIAITMNFLFEYLAKILLFENPSLLYFLVASPIYICILTNVYIKRLYEQYDLYYKKA